MNSLLCQFLLILRPQMSDDLITFPENSSEISRGLRSHMKTDVTAALRPGESRQDNAPYGDTGTPTAWRLPGPHPPPQAQRKRRGWELGVGQALPLLSLKTVTPGIGGRPSGCAAGTLMLGQCDGAPLLGYPQ